MARKKTTTKTKASSSYLDKLDSEVKSNQSKLSMVLGGLIVLVVGILIFNYFSKGSSEDLGPSQQTEQTGDVSPSNLPGKYTVKEGDTLFLIAEKYYKDGDKFTEISKANNLTDVNAIGVGQVLEIPKLESEVAEAPSPSASPSVKPSAIAAPSATPAPTAVEKPVVGKGGGDTTVWGPKIEGKTYTVVEGDWLSTISARAYGDIYAYDKIAKANNIQNPDLIYPGQVLTLPR